MLRMNRKKGQKGFTLIELLVVVLILAILMAIALPLYLSAVRDSQKKTCRANMQTIANAVQARFVRMNGAENYFNGDVTATDVAAGGKLEDLQTLPVCPEAAAATTTSYTVAGTAKTSFTVSCKINTDHGSYTPGNPGG